LNYPLNEYPQVEILGGFSLFPTLIFQLELNTNSAEGLCDNLTEGQTMAFATIDNLLEIDATLQDYGIQDFEAELAKAEQDIVKILIVRWWSGYLKGLPYDITRSTIFTLNPALLDETQWTDVTCYYALAHYILPKLSKFEGDPDRFRNMMDYYATRFNDLVDLEIRSGVHYDINGDEQFSLAEKQPTQSLRLVR